MSFLNFLFTVIVIIAAAIGIYYLVHWIMRKRSAEVVTSDEIQANIRRVQVIDVRETPEFNAKHILGARNIPYSQFKMRFSELRKDRPIYLVDESMTIASRCANILRKNGYEDVYILKDGFESWTGKVKSEL